jgi:hypothetical protein
MLLLLAACTADYVITVSPATVNLGVVDFAVEMPDEGYTPTQVSLTNAGKGTPVLALASYDPDHICVVGFTGRDLPISLGELPEGSTYLLNIAACGYLAGERDSEVSTDVVVSTDGSPGTVTIPVRFTPTRTIADDSG